MLVTAVLWGGLPVLGQDFQKNRGSGKGCIHSERPPNSPITISLKAGIQEAFYFSATNEYAHGVLGDAIEARAIMINVPNMKGFCDHIYAEENTVFEDVSPSLADINGDGRNEVIAVNSHKNFGARLAVYGYPSKGEDIQLLAATPYIGTRYRWLAPIGVADFNGDGDMDVAYVDRPHLAKTLRVWTYRNRKLIEIASIKGVTNHSIGEDFITSSVRTCDGRSEMILNDAQRKNIVAVFFENGTLTQKTLGKYTGPNSVLNPPAC